MFYKSISIFCKFPIPEKWSGQTNCLLQRWNLYMLSQLNLKLTQERSLSVSIFYSYVY